MILDYDGEAAGFRAEVRARLAENLPEDWPPPAGEQSPEDRAKFRQDWNEKLYAAGWICASWPAEYGGRGLSQLESLILAEEFSRARAPLRADWFGDTLVGPTILRWGTEEQKSTFIPKILRGEISWCQGFSEPEAGSDQARLRTSARLETGDEDGHWVINGQKTWTTRADEADYIFLLARTEPDEPRHKGLSYLLVPMRQPGVEVHPIEQLDGAAGFSEVFFTGARAPAAAVLGGRGNGWTVAMTTLGLERGVSSSMSHQRFEKGAGRHHRPGPGARRHRGPADPGPPGPVVDEGPADQVRQPAALFDALNGTHQADALRATTNLWWSRTHQDTLDLAMDLLGPDGQVLTGDPAGEGSWIPGVGLRRGRADYPASALQRAFLFSRSDTIGGGTSEIQLGIIAERVLKLPRARAPP
ncbi:MAG: acyl-CoA dehydrogenase family protein [Streptosporangiaceae bacterium]